MQTLVLSTIRSSCSLCNERFLGCALIFVCENKITAMNRGKTKSERGVGRGGENRKTHTKKNPPAMQASFLVVAGLFIACKQVLCENIPLQLLIISLVIHSSKTCNMK